MGHNVITQEQYLNSLRLNLILIGFIQKFNPEGNIRL